MISNASHYRFTTIAVLFLFLATAASAQQVEFSSTLNPVGSGARATGMGGAFIGVADDATAASWNPAGLIQLERPEVSVVYANFGREQTYHSASHPEIDTTNTASENAVNYLSAVFTPFVLFDRNVVVSINYQRLYEMNKNVGIRYNFEVANPADSLPLDISFQQDGYLYALSPAFAVQVSPSFSLGATVNLWKSYLGANGWDRTTRTYGVGTLGGGTPYTADIWQRDTTDFDGINMHLGFLWNATASLTVGGVIKTPFDAELSTTSMIVDNSLFGGTPAGTSGYAVRNETMEMPLSAGLGLQYRPTDRLILALDAYWTEWSKFVLKNAAGIEINPQSGKPLSQGSLEDTTQVRIGAEYLFIGSKSTIALRGGLFSDPEPTTGSTDNYYGFSLGTGYTTKAYSLDVSYQYRAGNDVTGDVVGIADNKTDVTQQTFMASAIFYF